MVITALPCAKPQAQGRLAESLVQSLPNKSPLSLSLPENHCAGEYYVHCYSVTVALHAMAIGQPALALLI